MRFCLRSQATHDGNSLRVDTLTLTKVLTNLSIHRNSYFPITLCWVWWLIIMCADCRLNPEAGLLPSNTPSVQHDTICGAYNVAGRSKYSGKTYINKNPRCWELSLSVSVGSFRVKPNNQSTNQPTTNSSFVYRSLNGQACLVGQVDESGTKEE